MVAVVDAVLTAKEQAELKRCDRTILKAQQSFREVGEALWIVNERRLYRQEYSTFEACCQHRWDLARSHAYRLIDAFLVVRDLSPTGDLLPANESQARPLVPLDADLRRTAWSAVIRRAAGTRITTPFVQQVVDELRGTGGGWKGGQVEEDAEDGAEVEAAPGAAERTFPCPLDVAKAVDALGEAFRGKVRQVHIEGLGGTVPAVAAALEKEFGKQQTQKTLLEIVLPSQRREAALLVRELCDDSDLEPAGLVRLEPQMVEELQSVANLWHYSVSEVARIFFEEGIAGEQKLMKKRQRVERRLKQKTAV